MRKIFSSALVAMFVSALPSFAGVAIFGSYWDTEAMGDTAGIGVVLRSDSKALAWELRGSYFPDITENLETLLDEDDSLVFDLEVEAIPIDLGIVYQFGSESGFRPYAGGGVSYFLLDSNAGSVSDEVGFYGVAGLELGSGTFGFVAEAIYRVIEGTLSTDVERLEDLVGIEVLDEIDLDLGGYGVNLGLVFRF